MTRPRSTLIDIESTSYYHCISRCVRRAFLWGEDYLTGKDYSHRKAWVIERLTTLNELFAIDICAYAIMSNHYHVVLRVDKEVQESWTQEMVIKRWGRLFSIPVLIRRYQAGQTSKAQTQEAEKIIATWRARLADVSWFMRCLNEYLARKANKEDNCTGRFWEGRFKSQALLDEAAVLTCMSYVDLNPIRAGIAEFPENSDYTSIKQRIENFQNKNNSQTISKSSSSMSYLPLLALDNVEDGHCHHFVFDTKDYFQLVDWAGRSIRKGKRGQIVEDAPDILHRLNICPDFYLKSLQSSHQRLSIPIALGGVDIINTFLKKTQRKFLRSYQSINPLFN